VKQFSDLRESLVETVELDEAMGKLNAKGEIEMTAKNYAKVHKDYKTKMKGVPYAMQIDPKTGGSALYPVKIIKESVEEGKKPVSQMTPAEKKADAERRKEYNAHQKSKRESVDLEEGKMKEFHDYIDQGKSAQWIAKKMGLDMKTVKELMADMKESIDNLQSESLDLLHENLRTLATKGMGAETKNTIKVGTEVDFYETERGDKLQGKIIKITPTGYVVQAMERGNTKKYTFKWHDRTKAKKLLESVEEGKTGAARLTNRLKKLGVDLDKRAKDRAASHAELKKKYAKESVELDESTSPKTLSDIRSER
jgi:hypothetical protein